MKRTHKTAMNMAVRIVAVAVGCALLLSPWISNMINERLEHSQISVAEKEIDSISLAQKEAYLFDAREYNSSLKQGTSRLVDPFISDASENAAADYDTLLDYSVTGIIGWIDIPKINVYLPVYHGTSDEVLSHGIGHLEGSSLPIGGESTHAVLAGHTGLSGQKLFTDLTEMEEGDWFFFHILGDTLAYQVSDIEVVLPEDTGSLQIVEGEDLMTLLTCTPYGINDHRLYVTGIRGEYSDGLYESEAEKVGTVKAGSVWMRKYRNALILAAAGIAGVCMVTAIVRKKKEVTK